MISGPMLWVGIAGLLLVAVIVGLDLRARPSGKATGGLGGWADWRRDLGYRGALRRARRRIPIGRLRELDRENEALQSDSSLVGFFGRARGHELFSQHEDSVVVIGPARSGKTRRWCARRVSSAIGAVIATSTKIDLVEATIRARMRLGCVVWAYDPLGLLSQPAPAEDHWDFSAHGGNGKRWARALLRLVRPGQAHQAEQGRGAPPVSTDELISHVRRLKWDAIAGCEDAEVALRRAGAWAAARPMENVKGGDLWTDAAAQVLARLLHAAALSGEDILTVRKWGNDLTDATPRTILQERGPRGWADLLESHSNSRAGETVDSVSFTLGSMLSCLDSPQVVDVLTPGPGERFDIAEFVARPNTLYLLASKRAGKSVGPLFTMLMDEILFVAGTLSQSMPGKFLWPPLRVVGDEIPQLAPLDDLDEHMADSGGRGIQVEVVVQSESQMRDRWGDKKTDAIMATAALRLYLPGVREEGVQKDLNRLAGKKYVRVGSGSRQSNGTGGRGTTSSSWSIVERDVLPQSEVRVIADGVAWMEYRNKKIGKVTLPDWSAPQDDGTALKEVVAGQYASRAQLSGATERGGCHGAH